MYIGCDVDGVLLDMQDRVREQAKRMYGMDLDVKSQTVYDMSQVVPKDVLRGIFSEPGTYESIPVYSGAREFLKKLREYGDVFAYTSVPACGFEGRVKQLRWLGFKNSEILMFSGDKPYIHWFDMLIEDDPSKVRQYVKMGSNVVLFDRPYNKKCGSGFSRAYGYQNVLDIVGWMCEYECRRGGVACKA